MAVTYEQARELVRQRFEPGWNHGTFCLDDREIGENDDFYVFNVGAREFIVDGDRSFAILGGVTVVLKENGQIDARPSAEIATDPTIRTRPNPDPTFTG